MAEVYISCDPKDAAAAERIQKDLNTRGITSCISDGRSASAVPIELGRAGFFVILISRHSLSSDSVKNELRWASDANRVIFPVRLDDTPLGDTFLFYLSTKQWIYAKRRLHAASGELGDVISADLRHVPRKPLHNGGDQVKDMVKDNRRFTLCIILFVVTAVSYLVASTICHELLRHNMDLYWNIDGILSFGLMAALILTIAPIYGGNKVFMRTILEKLRDLFRGKNKKTERNE